MSSAPVFEQNAPLSFQAEGLMQDIPAPADKLVTVDNFQQAPYNRWAFQHIPAILPCARVSRGTGAPLPLEYQSQQLGDIAFTDSEGESITVREMLTRTYTDAFLIMKNGKIVSENYYNGMSADSIHLLMSCTKSYVGTLAGLYVEQGLLDPAAPIVSYVPELEGTGFDGASLRQVLDMNAGVKYAEDYEDPNSEVRLSEIATGWGSLSAGYNGPTTQFEFLQSIKQKQSLDGEVYCYRSALTDVLGWAIEKVTGKRLQQLLHDVFWSQLGCEWDAAITVDRESTAMASGGLNCSLRDWGRFGQMMAQNGFYNGKQIIPESWVNDCRFGDAVSREAFARSKYEDVFPGGMYRNQWWVLDPVKGIYTANGVHGQTLYINPVDNIVIAKFSTQPKAEEHAMFLTQIAGMKAIAEALR